MRSLDYSYEKEVFLVSHATESSTATLKTGVFYDMVEG